MQWRHLFTKDNLNNGFDLYKTCGTSKVGYDGKGAYWCDVDGFLVEIERDDNKITEMSCECRYAKIGLRCKHMAATMFAIEEMELRESVKQKNSVRVYPFRRDEPDGKYRYFDLETIMEDQVVNDNVYQKAVKLINSNEIKIERIETDYSDVYRAGYWENNNKLSCKVTAVLQGRTYWNKVKICFDNYKVLYATCECNTCRNKYGSYNENLCFHQIATMLLAQNYIEKTNPGDATDKDGMNFLKAFKRQRILNSIDDESVLKNKVTLIPRIEGNPLKLGFKIGKSKLYVVKNLSQLVSAVENKERMQLGKKEELNFALDEFDEMSKKYYSIINQVVKDEENSAIDYTTGKNSLLGSSFLLYGSRLDLFFDLVENKSVECAKNYSNNRNGRVKFLNGDISLELTSAKVLDKSDVFQGITLKGFFPDFTKGAEHRYYENGGCVYRLKKEVEEKLLPLIEMSDYTNYFNVTIGRKNISDFYYNVLPQIQEWVQVDGITDDLIDKYIPPKAEYIFYLDMEETDIICKAKVLYGEEEYNLCDVENYDYEYEEIRNRDDESDVSNKLNRIFEHIDDEKKEYLCNNDEEKIYYILEHGINDLLEIGEVQTTDAFRKLKIKRIPKITVGVSVQSELLNLNIASDELSKEELIGILFGHRRKKKYYRLKNGDFINLQDDSLDDVSAMIDAMHLSEKDFLKDNMKLPLYRALYMDKLIEENDELYAKRDSYFKSIIKDFKTYKDSEFAVPQSLENVMRNYQKHGYRWLRTLEKCHFGGILADDMGLGKTLQIIAVLLADKIEKSAENNDGKSRQSGSSLIIAPASLVYNWKEELSRFAPSLSVLIIEGNQKQREKQIESYSGYDVVVTSYDLLKRDIAMYEDCRFKYEVIDEAQYIKNHTTAVAKAVKVIHSTNRYALTGTPIENRLSELWSIFDYLMPGFLYSYDNFKKEIEMPIVREQDEEAVAKLKKMISPFILRRLKEDVLKDLPEKVEELRYAVMGDEQRKLYDGQVVYMKEMINSSSDEKFAQNKIKLLAELTKIRQLCCDPSLVFESYKGESAKRQTCMDLVKSAIDGEHRILIFSQFTSMLELLEQDLKKEKIEFYEITGATAKQERVRLVNRFNEGNVPVFLISLKAGGTGLNLVGADIVIHFDPWWNIAAQNQATDRAYRIGQTRSVSVYKIIIKNSIEEKIVKLQEDKRQLADEILMGEMGSITSMSREELLDLME
ncbi:MAG: SNF2 helicase associated domain-containing protein [Lachnospiraceae bacterium]|nr:SNF2 helicase associated domain-containing protein [Lachnospiraceae bacterium]